MQEPLAPTSTPTYEIFDLGGVAVKLLRWKWLLLLFGIAGGVGAFFASDLMPKKYRVAATLMPADNQEASASLANSLGGIAKFAGLSTESDLSNEAMATLRSYAFITKFIEEEGLVSQLFSEEELRQKPGPTMSDAYEVLMEHIGVARDEEAGVVTISMLWHEPEVAAKWLNGLVVRLNSKLQLAAMDKSARSVTFLEEQVRNTSFVELRQSIYTLMQTELHKRMVASVSPDYAFKVIDPAHVPDSDDYASPNKKLLVVIGFILGMAFCAFMILRFSKR